MLRRIAVILALATVVGLSAGCQPEPAPAPTAPVFASEDAAFAAAEETYRAYVDALNQVDLSDPETFEAVYAWTTGEANEGARKSFSQMHADGWVVGGESLVATVRPLQAVLQGARAVSLTACLDVSAVTLVDAEGTSVVDADRPDVQEVLVTLIPAGSSPTGLLIENLDGSDEGICE